ncbi:MAG: ABC transporter substrate-binding protein [Gammaproteobacteria bacterium]
MKKSFYRLFSLFSLFLLTLFFSQTQAETLKVGMIHWIAYSPLNVADVQGFWKEQGLDVKVINFGSNQELNNALQNKGIDIALDMIGSWVGISQSGVPLVILGETDWSHGGDKIITKKDVDFSKLKGQNIGVYLNQPSVTYFLNKFLSEKQWVLS